VEKNKEDKEKRIKEQIELAHKHAETMLSTTSGMSLAGAILVAKIYLKAVEACSEAKDFSEALEQSETVIAKMNFTIVDLKKGPHDA
jgi:enamine deaminase RidA (YjgF/YER057c/UK114 family)